MHNKECLVITLDDLQRLIEGALPTLSGSRPKRKHKEILIYGRKFIIPASVDFCEDKTFDDVAGQNSILKHCEVKSGVFQDSFLLETTIINAEIHNCLFVKCKVFGSTIHESELRECTVRKRFPNDPIPDDPKKETSHRTSLLSNCWIIGGKIYDTDVINSVLIGLDSVQMCKNIKNTEVKNSSIVKSDLHSCVVDHSELLRCEVFDGLLTSVTRASPLGFGVFPPEIRTMFFEDAIKADGASSPLFAALLRDKNLHTEIVQLYFRGKIFELSQRSETVLINWPRTSVRYIEKLDISNLFPIDTKDVSLYFPQGMHFTEVVLRFLGLHLNIDRFYNVVKKWLPEFDEVQNFKVVWESSEWSTLADPYAFHPPATMTGAINVAIKRLKVSTIENKSKSTIHTWSKVTPVLEKDEIIIPGNPQFGARDTRSVKWTWAWLGSDKAFVWDDRAKEAMELNKIPDNESASETSN